MKHFKIIIFAIVVLWTNCSFAQTTFEKLYQYLQVHRGFQVSEIDSGNFLFLTDLYDCALCVHKTEFLKINKYGDTILTYAYNCGYETSASKFVQTENSFIVPINSSPGGGDGIITTLKVDSILHVVWNNVFSVPGFSIDAEDIINTSDSNFVICGNAVNDSTQQIDFLILKLNAVGNTLWYKIIPFDSNNIIMRNVIESDSAYLIFTGTLESSSTTGQTIIYETDSLGDSLMTRLYSLNLFSQPNFIKARGNQFILGGWESGSNMLTADGFVLFLNSNFDSTSSYIFDMGYLENIFSVAFNSSTILFTANSHAVAYILKFDTNNTFISYRTIGSYNNQPDAMPISFTSDSGLIIGSTVQFGGGQAAWLIKTDINGDLLNTDEIKNQSSEIIFPNPSKGIFYLNGKNPVKKCTVYSILGKKVREFSGNEMDLSEYEDGIYFYEAEFFSGLVQKGKLIKIN